MCKMKWYPSKNSANLILHSRSAHHSFQQTLRQHLIYCLCQLQGNSLVSHHLCQLIQRHRCFRHYIPQLMLDRSGKNFLHHRSSSQIGNIRNLDPDIAEVLLRSFGKHQNSHVQRLQMFRKTWYQLHILCNLQHICIDRLLIQCTVDLLQILMKGFQIHARKCQHFNSHLCVRGDLRR